MSLNKLVLVTGGTKGIGREISIQLANAGMHVVACFNNDTEMANELETYAKKNSLMIAVICADISKSASCKLLIDFAKETYGSSYNFLVNNAGILNQGDFFELTEEQWDNTFSTNLKGPFFLSQKLIPIMGQNGGGAIVNVVSVGAQTGGPKAPDYSASKGALMTFTQSMSRIGADYQVRVNAVSPGWILTDIFTNSQKEQLEKTADSIIPLKRLGTPVDVANAVEFLLSNKSSYITGHILNVNGGMHF
jgi:3-oxoacyl-[acyl-carrier protein] reductase